MSSGSCPCPPCPPSRCGPWKMLVQTGDGGPAVGTVCGCDQGHSCGDPRRPGTCERNRGPKLQGGPLLPCQLEGHAALLGGATHRPLERFSREGLKLQVLPSNINKRKVDSTFGEIKKVEKRSGNKAASSALLRERPWRPCVSSQVCFPELLSLPPSLPRAA